MRVGINGYGRMGRLALRAGIDRDDLEFVAINEPHAPAATLATLTEFDSVQGRWDRTCGADGEALVLGDARLAVTAHDLPGAIPWEQLGVELVLECSGEFRTTALLEPHFERGARRVVVSAPVKDGPPNLVVGVNHDSVDLAEHRIVTAASCTTNCLAPIVRVLHDTIGIERGVVTTIHNPTNTQRVHDAPHRDPRRARASQLSLIPTSTNSATAVTLIIPELAGKLDSIAVRAPVLNASLVDFVFTASRATDVEEVNAALSAAAAAGPLVGILGVEDRPLVSCDFAGDPRSGIVDLDCTRVTDASLVKVMAWYDNEWGYANRLVELAGMVAAASGDRG
ncbi:MAG: type I glyceraldehyde-3-phosphate dehydrogenase [Planctomycetota bacterium]|nr:type I glyceraldehyde-3-phosphate dehydrogenase [Planctomycetota bacterium]